ncbi:hypothetical protein MUGA111182_17380 [Mucilaginibacter galii]|uniref:hypothetical protein n=1 Tax=Mucilaginibacter galii TaxID=2005073 RepID=UPI001663585D|nr:hypothetical protein [Mucilaginibacter galii]
MKLDTPLNQLQYFLPDDLFLLRADRDAYRNPIAQPSEPLAPIETPTIIDETPVITFKYLGDNQKNFLVLTHYTADEFIAEAHLNALISTVTRINYSLQDLAIVNLAHTQAANWEQLSQFFKPQKLLILGSKALPSNLPALVLNETDQADNCQALYTFAFEEMMGNKENTKAFWNQIKTF